MTSARLIVNEGQGARPVELVAERLTVGMSPGCDVELTHASAEGAQLVVVQTQTGHRVVRITGDVFLNEEGVEVGDLLHNDTVRVGEVMLLYKNPEAVAPPEAVEEIEELEELEDLDELEEIDALEDLDKPEPEPPPPPPPPPTPEPKSRTALAPEPLEELEEPVVDDASAELEELDLDELEEVIDHLEVEESATPTSPPRPATTTQEGPIRFTRPLPEGYAAPTTPPPADPGGPPT